MVRLSHHHTLSDLTDWRVIKPNGESADMIPGCESLHQSSTPPSTRLTRVSPFSDLFGGCRSQYFPLFGFQAHFVGSSRFDLSLLFADLSANFTTCCSPKPSTLSPLACIKLAIIDEVWLLVIILISVQVVATIERVQNEETAEFLLRIHRQSSHVINQKPLIDWAGLADERLSLPPSITHYTW